MECGPQDTESEARREGPGGPVEVPKDLSAVKAARHIVVDITPMAKPGRHCATPLG